MHGVGAHHGEGRVESQSVLLTADLLHQAGRNISDPANKNWRSTRVRACVRAVARCTVAWHSAVNTQLKRRGLTSRAPKTSLIQYFRWRNRASEQLLTAAAESRQDSSSPVAEPKSKYIASGRTPSPLGFPREVYDSAEVTASAEVCRQCEGSALSEGRYIHIFFPHCLPRPWTTHNTRGLCRNSSEILQLPVPSGGFLCCTCWIILPQRWVILFTLWSLKGVFI